MKKILTNYAAWLVLVVMVILLIPGLGNRIENENKNNNVTVSLLYNDIRNKVSADTLSKILKEYKSKGFNVVSLMENDVNALVGRGDITSIKYNVLRHKYDDESMRIADAIKENCPDVSYDSHILLVKRENEKKQLSGMIPLKYSDKEYKKLENVENMDIYVFYDGRKNLWDISLGYEEDVIKELSEEGFEVVLVHKVKNYSETLYLDDMERLIKKYDIRYLNIKEDANKYKADNINEKNYKGISRIINENDMTLVVTENSDQLSNQKALGYSYIFNEAMKDGGPKKVIRSYETYDNSHADETNYKYRTNQYFNSTVDRNIRFINVTQIVVDNATFEECADYTLKAAEYYKEKIEGLGFTVNSQQNKLDYTANKKLNAAACAVIMVMCALLILQMLISKKIFKLTVFALILSVFAFGITFVMPSSLIALYPSLYSVVMSSFAMTLLLYFVKVKKDKCGFFKLFIGSLIIILSSLLIGAVGMGSMLSGIDYYINNEIFRGIKISLLVPVVYTAVIFFFMFLKEEKTTFIEYIRKVLYSDIKVYWVIIAGVIGMVGIYYIIRSGNVNSISSFETFMRNAITEIFPARPRTKEFLVGYPSLLLFVFYVKKSDFRLLQGVFAVGTSVLAASVTNSFCHVFTDISVIFMRVVNGLFVGLAVSVVAYIANLVLFKILNALKDKFIKNSEMM